MKQISFIILSIFLVSYLAFVSIAYQPMDTLIIKCKEKTCINQLAQCINNKYTSNYYLMNCDNLKPYIKWCETNEDERCSKLILSDGEILVQKPYLIKYGIGILISISAFIWFIDKLIGVKNDLYKTQK